MNELALFAGAGGGILGGHLLGWRTVCAVEFEPYAASVLVARQNNGILPPFPIWDDVRTFDGRPWRGLVDVVSGGFPCQDISAAGNGAGIDGERSGLWREMARIVGEVRPRFVFVENSPLLVRRGLAVVLGELTELGYDARWCVMGAADVGAPHQRDRIWIVANASRGRRSEPSGRQVEQPRRTEAECSGEALADTNCIRCEQVEQPVDCRQKGARPTSSTEHSCIATERSGWPVEPDVGGMADELAHGLDVIGGYYS
ncbi:TPA: DNA cytosine methyltransferase [Pseudomonas aeruginosa]|nr:DNA cytosine methyltransferase [Pseudomonas aeruginosa]